VGTLGFGIMNSTAFSLSANSNPQVDGNQISFGTVDFQPHPPTLTPVFTSLDQEMDLTIKSLKFCVGSLGSIRLSDLTKLGPSVGKTAFAAMSELSVGSSNEVNSLVSFTPTKNIGDTTKELDEIMENLNLGETLGDFMICCNSTSDKSTDTWKAGLELHEDDQAIFSSFSSKINHSTKYL
jgi:hypothetical protein